MTKPSNEEIERGKMITLLKRASRRRIPRLLRIKAAVDRGARLSDFQINFLSKVFDDAQQAIPYFDSHPEVQEIATKMVSLYQQITQRALENEKTNLKRKAPDINLPGK